MRAPRIRFSESDELAQGLERLRAALSAHPIAAQAIFCALVSEGRAFAKTSEGADWMARLASSELLDRLRVVWGGVGMNAFVERDGDVLPSYYLDAALRAARQPELEALLSSLFGLDT